MLTVWPTILDSYLKNSIREREGIFDNKILYRYYTYITNYFIIGTRILGEMRGYYSKSSLTLLLLKYQLKNEIYTG